MKKPTNMFLRVLAALGLSLGASHLHGESSQAGEPASSSSTVTGTETSTVAINSEEPGEKAIVMNPFDVSTDTDYGYGAYATSSTGRVVRNYVDVPQTVNVVTSEFMQGFNVIDARTALEYVPGLQLGIPENGNDYVRGVAITTTFLDGLPQYFPSGAYSEIPIDFMDRVEVVKGPSSAEFGLGQPGGIINYVSKTPTGAGGTSISLSFGMFDDMHFSIDSQGVSKTYPKLSYRLVAYHEGGPTADRDTPADENGVQLALRYKLSGTTTLDLITSDSDNEEPRDYIEANDFKDYVNYAVYNSGLGAPIAFGSSVSKWQYLPGTEFTNGSIFGVSGTLPLPGAIPIRGTGDLLGADANPQPNGFPGQRIFDYRTTGTISTTLADGHINLREALRLEFTEYNFVDQQIQGGFGNGVFSIPGAANTLPAGLTNGGVPTGLWAGTNNAPGTAFQASVGPPQTYIFYTPATASFNSSSRQDDLDVTANYTFFGIKSQSLVGMDFYNESYTSFSESIPGIRGNGAFADYNFYSDNNGNWFEPNPGSWTAGALTSLENWGDGFYAQEDASMFHGLLDFSAAWRIDYYQTHTFATAATNVGTYTRTPWENTGGAPQYSITLKPTSWLSVYELYSKHKDPAASTTKYLLTGPPENNAALLAAFPDYQSNPLVFYNPGGVTIESGLKASFLDGKLYFSAAVYHDITVGNVVLGQPIGTFNNADGTAVQVNDHLVEGFNTHGIELELFGQPTQRLVLTANMAECHGTGPNFTSGSGLSFVQSPYWLDPGTDFSFHAKFDMGGLGFLPGRIGQGFYATLGNLFVGPHWEAEGPYSYNYVYNYNWGCVWDGGIGYRWRSGKYQMSIDANVDNMFNTIVSSGSQDNNQWTILPQRRGYISFRIKD